MIPRTRLALYLTGMMLSAIVLLSLSASAGHPLHRFFGATVPDCIGKWCPDEYCPKQEPCECVPLCFGCDDYCGKKAPCVCAPLCFACDDYCKKCPPKVCSGPVCQFLKCGPPRQPCGCAACVAATSDALMVRSADLDERLQIEKEDKVVKGQPPVVVRAPEIKLTK